MSLPVTTTFAPTARTPTPGASPSSSRTVSASPSDLPPPTLTLMSRWLPSPSHRCTLVSPGLLPMKTSSFRPTVNTDTISPSPIATRRRLPGTRRIAASPAYSVMDWLSRGAVDGRASPAIAPLRPATPPTSWIAPPAGRVAAGSLASACACAAGLPAALVALAACGTSADCACAVHPGAPTSTTPSAHAIATPRRATPRSLLCLILNPFHQ